MNDEVINEFFVSLESSFENLFTFLKRLDEIEFEEEILAILEELIIRIPYESKIYIILYSCITPLY